MERQIRSARYDMDAGKVFIMYEDGGRAYCHIVKQLSGERSAAEAEAMAREFMMYCDAT